jgi:hypothetical protein
MGLTASHAADSRTKDIRVLAVVVAELKLSERRGKGAQRRAHQSVSGSSDVPLSAAQDRRWTGFLRACARRRRQ